MKEAVDVGAVWRLEDLYNGPDDPQISADMDRCRREASLLADEYRGRLATLLPHEFHEAVQRLERLLEQARKLISYAYLNFSTQTQDPTAGALRQSAQEFDSLIDRDTLFFEIEWTAMDDAAAQSLLRRPETARYRHYLESLRRFKPHILSETEERVLAETEPVRAPAWATLFDKVLGGLRFGKRRRTESETLNDLYGPDRRARRVAATDLTEGLKSSLHILTHIFNTIILDKSITDRLKHYPHWLRERNLSNEIDDGGVEALIEAVSSRHDLVRRYYRLKKKLLGYKELFDYDRYAPVPGLPTADIPWDRARETVLEAYEGFSPEMAEIARDFFDREWIHAPTIPGKRSGAFSHPTIPSVHPYVFLNYAGAYRDVMTLAHELGHGVHQYLASSQGLFNSETPLTMAETASIFGEMLVFKHMLGSIDSPRERLAMICRKLEDIIATVFRQVAMSRFEEAVHNERRVKGDLDSDRLSVLWMDSQTRMFGDSVTLLEHYSVWWSYIPHFIHSPGYVYAYAFGELLVLALQQQYTEKGSDFVPLYIQLLRAGAGAAPVELLAPLGIDPVDPTFWSRGLSLLEDLLLEAEGEMKSL